MIRTTNGVLNQWRAFSIGTIDATKRKTPPGEAGFS